MAEFGYFAGWPTPLYGLDLSFPNFGNMSTTPGSFPEDESREEISEDTTTAPFQFEFTWQDLRSCAQYINDRGWSQAPVPAVLDTLPENVVVSPQLQQILSWSLQRFDEPTLDDSTNKEPKESINVAPTVAREGWPTRSNTVIVTKARSDEAPEALLARAKSQKSLPLITRLRQLRQDVASKVASSASSSSSGTKDPQAPLPKQIVEEAKPNGECISCFDEFPKWDLVHLKCSHDYCKPCLREVVFTAMKNEAAFPPKCCLTEIPLKTVLVSLEQKQRDEYREKSAEYAIPAGHRWYCPEPKCGKWIKPEKLHKNRRSHQTCPHCKAGICSMCRSLAHDTNQDCPQDFGLESTLEIAESQGWRRCYSCRTMVELTTGCRHITCRCGAQFCYVCNAVWRTCNCTEADKERRIRELRAQYEQRTQMEEEERRRREEEDEAARIEAEEMAEAIRQVEEIERQDAIRRVEEERQRQLEEELMLAQLEEARLLEEIARREEEEEAERQFREILITSSKEECQAMMKTLMQIINYQHTALMSSHQTREDGVKEEKEFKKAQQASEFDTSWRWLQENVNRRKANLDTKHQSERDALLVQSDYTEDEMFMNMQIYLRDKPHREQREKKMRDAFQRQKQENEDRLQQRQATERRWFEMGANYEFEGLRKYASMHTKPPEKEDDTALKELGTLIGYDRQWFQLISTRRINMLNEHKKIILQQLEAREEPNGLTKDEARLVAPIPPIPQDENTEPSSVKPLLLTGLPAQQAETSDLYGAASERPTSTSIQRKPVSTTPHRSDTVIRSVPGAFPAPTSTSTSAQPQLPSQDSIMNRPRPPTSRASQRPDNTTPSSPSTISLSSPPDQSQTTSEPTTSSTQASLSSYDSTTNSSTATLSPITTPSSKHSSIQSTSAFSTSTSTTNSGISSNSMNTDSSASTTTDTSLLDTIPTDAIARHRDSQSQTLPQDKKKGSLGSRLRGFAKKKEYSDEEIRWRMTTRATVGDGWGI